MPRYRLYVDESGDHTMGNWPNPNILNFGVDGGVNIIV